MFLIFPSTIQARLIPRLLKNAASAKSYFTVTEGDDLGFRDGVSALTWRTTSL
jgi:hypothetical protein